MVFGWDDALGLFAGGLIGGASARQQNQAAAYQSDRMVEFQERMSNTAHQREVADLRAAGLNPILSANSGASSPQGAQAPVVGEGEKVIAGAKESQAIKAVEKKIDAELDVLESQATKNNMDAALSEANIKALGKQSTIGDFWLRAGKYANKALDKVEGALNDTSAKGVSVNKNVEKNSTPANKEQVEKIQQGIYPRGGLR